MNLFQIAWKSIRQRALSSSLTGLNMALGVMLMIAVLLTYGIVKEAFSKQSTGFHLVVGPKGSKIDLVLSSVYHTAPPIENLPYLYYKELQNHPDIQEAIPIAFGDTTQSHEGFFPIVGTIPRYFELPYSEEETFKIRGKQMGRKFDAVIGAKVAETNGWDVGSTFKMLHGGVDDPNAHVHDEEFTIVAVLARTGTPNDKTVFVNLDGFYAMSGHDKPVEEAIAQLKKFYPEGVPGGEERINELRKWAKEEAEAHAHHDHGHDHHGHDHSGHDHAHHDHGSHEMPDEVKEVTSIFLTMKGDDGDEQLRAFKFMNELKTGYKAEAANPFATMNKLMNELVGGIQKMMAVLISLIIIVSGVSIFVSIYNSMSDRRKEIGIMRALGAQRRTVFSIILAESILLCLGGGALGIILGHGIVILAAPYIEQVTGLIISPFAFEWLELVLIPALLGLAALIGFLPGITAYKTDVAEALSD